MRLVLERRIIELTPMADKYTKKWLACRRSDAAYYCGDIDSALKFAKEVEDIPFFKELATRLADPAILESRKRVVLPVGFVRQHHMTCAPATLSALSRFWSMPAAHLEIAEKICYDGTPAHSERGWAEQAGYIPREFTVTWDSARTLLDLGIPFTLTTVEPGNARTLIDYGMAIKHAVEARLEVVHPLDSGLRGIYGTIVTGRPGDGADGRNVTIFADGEVDRSPCGTGTAARLAWLHAQGALPADRPYVHESIIGSRFTGRVLRETTIGSHSAIVPEIAGHAFITGYHTFVVDSDDPVGAGFLVR